MTDFKDNFSKQSTIYRKYRPDYPIELFDYLHTLTKDHTLAWDCGTGNGQAALSLTKYYTKVYATDPSEQQIKNAPPHNQVEYKVEKAEESELDNESAYLITIAQALHWFDFDTFYAEAKRVLKKNGVIAAWAYGLPAISTEIDELVRYFHDEVIGDYWQYENQLVNEGYATIPFPFEELSTPVFRIYKTVSLDDLLGLINSWSAIQRYKNKHGDSPVDDVENALLKRWGDKRKAKNASWDIVLKAGKK